MRRLLLSAAALIALLAPAAAQESDVYGECVLRQAVAELDGKEPTETRITLAVALGSSRCQKEARIVEAAKGRAYTNVVLRDIEKVLAANLRVVEPAASQVKVRTASTGGARAKVTHPACTFWDDIHKYVTLVSEGRPDVADRLDCWVVPEGQPLIILDQHSLWYKVFADLPGAPDELWTRREFVTR